MSRGLFGLQIDAMKALGYEPERSQMNTETEAKAGHTAVPWIYEENRHANNVGIYRDVTKPEDSHPSYECIAFLDTFDDDANQPIPNAVANAAFIVRAVNAHEELLNICKAYLLRLESVELKTDTQIDLWKRVHDAIAKSEAHS